MDTPSTPHVAAYAWDAYTEVAGDIEDGLVAACVASFAELHEYVDANEYLEDANEAGGLDLANAVADLIDAVLRGDLAADNLADDAASRPRRRGLFTLWDVPGAYVIHRWRTTETDARQYAERYRRAGAILTGPRGETLERY